MILDPNRNGIEIYYDNKLINLEGSPDVCLDYIIDLTCDTIDYYNDPNSLYEVGVFRHKEKSYQQLSKIILDCNAIGRVYEDLFRRVGLKYDKLEVKRIRLD